ncbi:hypothetical protein, partial [Paenibacillus agricola]
MEFKFRIAAAPRWCVLALLTLLLAACTQAPMQTQPANVPNPLPPSPVTDQKIASISQSIVPSLQKLE